MKTESLVDLDVMGIGLMVAIMFAYGLVVEGMFILMIWLILRAIGG